MAQTTKQTQNQNHQEKLKLVHWWWTVFYIYDTVTQQHISKHNSLKEAIYFIKELRKLEKETERTRDGSAMSQWRI